MLKKGMDLDGLMKSIRKNTKGSGCIDNFEGLLREIKDPRICNVIVNGMSGFLSDLFKVFHIIDGIKGNVLEIKSKMLKETFIEPNRYFKKSKRLANNIMKYRAAFEYLDKAPTKITVNADKQRITIKYKEAMELTKSGIWGDKKEDVSELARKVMLLYNHIPAVVKALIQTKRRSLGLDDNSYKFEGKKEKRV